MDEHGITSWLTDKAKTIDKLRIFSTSELGIVAGMNNTNEINSAIEFIKLMGGGILKFTDDATYMIDGAIGINLKDDISLDFSSGAKLKSITNLTGWYSVVKAVNVKNVSLINPYIIGDRATHVGTEGEWGFGLDIRNSQNVTVYNAVIEDCWGDGVYLGNSGTKDYNRNITFLGKTIIRNCRRIGISVICALDSYAEHLQIEGISGTQPSAAIDFEPNHPYEVIDNFVIKTLTAVRCEESALFVYSGSKFGITINNIEAIDCIIPTMTFNGFVQNQNSGYINIGKIYINKIVNRPTIELNNWYVDYNPIVYIDNIVIEDWENSSLALSDTFYTYLRLVVSKVDPAWLKSGGITVGRIHVNKTQMAKKFRNFYASLVGVKAPAGFKFANIKLGISPTSLQGYSGSWSHMPLEQATCKESVLNSELDRITRVTSTNFTPINFETAYVDIGSGDFETTFKLTFDNPTYKKSIMVFVKDTKTTFNLLDTGFLSAVTLNGRTNGIVIGGNGEISYNFKIGDKVMFERALDGTTLNIVILKSIIPNKLKAIKTGINTDAATVISNVDYPYHMGLFHYDSAREGNVNFPISSRGFITQYNDTSFGSFQIATSINDEKMFIRTINQSGVVSPFKQIRTGESGNVTYSGDGSTIIKTISHGLGSTPSYWDVNVASLDAGNAEIRFVTADETNITVTFKTAPIAGTNNIKLTWKVET
ncbi:MULTISPECIES: hypothetical protein [unclassified Peribacillus]|uniref:hypothetical protein n=1 Tax=unclassified Peribacillus TaxID=2675266 RepID=UPI0036702E28